MRILSIIPARSGSKSVKNKNMKKFLGQPLIKHTIEFSKKLKNVTTFVSTDSIKILRYVSRLGIKYNYLRPKYLSRDNSNVVYAALHALEWFSNKNIFFDYLLLLQPTSPLRDLKEVKKIINLAKNKKINSIITATEMKEHPYECIIINKKKWKYLSRSNTKEKYLRQHYEKDFYYIDGSVYLTNVNFFQKIKKFVSLRHTFIYKSKSKNQIDINTHQDFKVGEILKKYKI